MSDTFPTITNKKELEAGSVLAPRFDASGLITAIVQDANNGEILMLAHMNEEALLKTIETDQAHFWSRSRQELWLKGATSGNILHVKELRTDCDQDAILLKVDLEGEGACHTGARSCFYRKIETISDAHSLVEIKD